MRVTAIMIESGGREGERRREDGCRPHLAPCFVHFISQRLDLVELGHVGGYDEHVGLAHDADEGLAHFLEGVLRHICDGYF